MNVNKEVLIKHSMKMKKYLFLFSLFLFSSIFSFSQEKESNLQLLKLYSESELNEMIQKSPEKYKALVYGLENATYITDFPKGKEVEKSISLPSGEFNYIDLGLKIKNTNQYFKVTGTNKILVVKSFYVLENEIKTKKS